MYIIINYNYYKCIILHYNNIKYKRFIIFNFQIIIIHRFGLVGF